MPQATQLFGVSDRLRVVDDDFRGQWRDVEVIEVTTNGNPIPAKSRPVIVCRTIHPHWPEEVILTLMPIKGGQEGWCRSERDELLGGYMPVSNWPCKITRL